MHKTVKKLIEEAQAYIDEYQGRQYWEEEVAEKQNRIKLLRQLWRKFGSTPLVKQMTMVVDEKVEHYHADFFLHDLRSFEKFSGRFAWFVGDCGTHLIWLDNETPEENERERGWLKAVHDAYAYKYTLYEGDTSKGMLKKTRYENLEFRLVPGEVVKVG